MWGNSAEGRKRSAMVRAQRAGDRLRMLLSSASEGASLAQAAARAEMTPEGARTLLRHRLGSSAWPPAPAKATGIAPSPSLEEES